MREQGVKTRHKANIYSVYVAPEAQGRGIARALLEQALAEARKQRGLEQIMLAVVTTNATAMRLYQSLGFERYGVEPRALKVAAQYFDEALMVLRLE